MKLSRYCYFRRYFDDVVVCDTKYRKFYVMNHMAADILEILGNGFSSIESIADKLKFQYDASTEEIVTACSDFIDELYKIGIIENAAGQVNLPLPKSFDYTSDLDVEQDFIQKLGESETLYSALIELTHKCNLSCKHCYVINSKRSSLQPELTTQQVFNLLDDLYDNNVFRIIFTGGEVFVRPDFLRILEYATSKRFLIDIYSNGINVSEEDIKKISKLNIRSFQSSLYGSNAITHDSITGQNGSFFATVKTLKLLSSLGIATNIKSSFMKNNFSEYNGIKALATDIGASFQPSFSIMPAIDGNKVALPLRVEDPLIISEVMEFARKSTTIDREMRLSAHICSAGLSGISIDPYGNVYACNTLRVKIGSILDSSIKDIWHNSFELKKIRAIRNRDRKQCVQCSHFDVCNFCPGIALTETGNMLKPYAEACTIAQAHSNTFKEGG